jgi:hypothetical protein
MASIVSRPSALLCATLVVAVSAWALNAPYLAGVNGRWGETTIIDCFCIPIQFDDTEHWQTHYADRFHLRAPDGAVLHRESSASGSIEDYRYTLTYALVPADDGGAFAQTGSDYREESLDVGGKPALLRSAHFKGCADPLFLQLIVPRAVKTKDGRWLTLEIHGYQRSFERNWLAERVLRTIDFAPPYDVLLSPSVPRIVMPMIEVETP